MNMAFFILFNSLKSTKTVACHVKGGGDCNKTPIICGVMSHVLWCYVACLVMVCRMSCGVMSHVL